MFASLVVLVFSAAPALAQAPAAAPAAEATAAPVPLIGFSAAFGAGLVTLGAAFGIGKLASSAYESMARQPEVAGNIQTAMIIAAALIEGFTFFALVVCLNSVGK
ncbi:MAG: ATP synthase F0 subunit C [Pirellula sp.]|nr:ATP synthase F0 subunit C [Pirellula sp.]